MSYISLSIQTKSMFARRTWLQLRTQSKREENIFFVIFVVIRIKHNSSHVAFSVSLLCSQTIIFFIRTFSIAIQIIPIFIISLPRRFSCLFLAFPISYLFLENNPCLCQFFFCGFYRFTKEEKTQCNWRSSCIKGKSGTRFHSQLKSRLR